MGNVVGIAIAAVIIIPLVIVLALAYTKPEMVKIPIPECPTPKSCPVCEDTAPLRTQISSLNGSLNEAESKITELESNADVLRSQLTNNDEYIYLSSHDAGASDIKTVVGTVKQCVAACNSTPRCGSIVRSRDVSPTQSADCYLKSVPVFDSRFKLYVPRRADDQLYFNTDIAVGEYKSIPKTDEAFCYASCDADMKCKAASFSYGENWDDYTCSLKSNSSPLTVKTNTNVYIPKIPKASIEGCGYAGMTRGFYKLGSDAGRYSFCRYVGDSPSVMPACIIDGVDTMMVQTENGLPKLDTAGNQIPISMVGEDGRVFNMDSTPHDEFEASEFYCAW